MSSLVTGLGTTSRPLFGNKAAVIADLERRITNGELAVGTRLPSERELCAQYRVSRPIIREVLRGLEERGYIDIYASRGSFVRELTQQDLAEPLARMALRAGVTPRDLVRARIVLESAAAAAAAEGRSDEQLEHIRRALQDHDEASTTLEQARTDVAFHEAIMSAAGNPVIEMMFASIRNLAFGLMLRSHNDARVHTAGDPLHAVIFDRIAARDTDGAAQAMQEHISLALELYGDDLDRNLDEILVARGFGVQTVADVGLGV